MNTVETNYPRTRTTSDWQAAVTDPDVQAVVIATPASSHYKLAKAALEFGKHVFVEKPLAMCLQDADDLAVLANSRARTLVVGDPFLYNAAVRYIRRLLLDNKLGDIYYIYSQRLNLGQVRTDVNVWVESGST